MMLPIPSVAAALGAASLLLSCSSAAPTGPRLIARSSDGGSSKSIDSRTSTSDADALQPRWQHFDPNAPLPNNFWNNPDILYFFQTAFEAFENVRVLGPRQPQISERLVGEAAVAAQASKPEPTAPEGLINTLGTGQDPSIASVMTERGQVYYSADIDFWTKSQISSSMNLSDLIRGDLQTVSTSKDVIITEAPDLARWTDDRWIYTVSSVKYDHISSFVSDSSDPLGTWGVQSLITCEGTPISGFDSHVFTHPNGKFYIIWSNHATLIIAELLTATTIGKPSTVVSMMGEPKNPLNFWNNEAPSTVIAPNVNGSSTINLVFSTGDFRTPNYTTRVLTSDASSDPLSQRSWTLQRTPVLATDASRSVYGPGSVCFFDCEDRKCVGYGAWSRANTISDGGKRRSIRIQHVDFDASGQLQPMTPIIPTSLAS